MEDYEGWLDSTSIDTMWFDRWKSDILKDPTIIKIWRTNVTARFDSTDEFDDMSYFSELSDQKEDCVCVVSVPWGEPVKQCNM